MITNTLKQVFANFDRSVVFTSRSDAYNLRPGDYRGDDRQSDR